MHTDSLPVLACDGVPERVNVTSSYNLLSPGFETNDYGDRRNCSTRVTSPKGTHVSKSLHEGE